jgi:hypothetical protein
MKNITELIKESRTNGLVFDIEESRANYCFAHVWQTQMKGGESIELYIVNNANELRIEDQYDADDYEEYAADINKFKKDLEELGTGEYIENLNGVGDDDVWFRLW